jgi:hypothetical protein
LAICTPWNAFPAATTLQAVRIIKLRGTVKGINRLAPLLLQPFYLIKALHKHAEVT